MNGLMAESWVRGAVTVLESSGVVSIDVPSEDARYDDFTKPVYFSGLFSARAQSDGSVLLHTSNKVTLSFSGEGVFSIERFESIVGGDPAAQGKFSETDSRMILGLRRGELLIDTRSLPQDSKFVVETPLGRIFCVKAVLKIGIEHDYRSGIYNLTISTSDGMVRFIDIRREVYTIYAGQRISGAGSYFEPAVEVGAQTDDMREEFEDFIVVLDGLDLEAIDQAELRSHSLELRAVKEVEAALTHIPEEGVPTETRRPRVIEFAPRAEYVTPFRAEVEPPSDWQADLF